MYLDKENAFFYKKDLSKGLVSDVIQNGNGGDAYEACWLYACVNAALSGAATLKLETADKEDMSSPVTVGTYTVAAATGSNLAVRLPVGLKKYLRITVTGPSTGTFTACTAKDIRIQ